MSKFIYFLLDKLPKASSKTAKSLRMFDLKIIWFLFYDSLKKRKDEKNTFV